MSHAAETWFHNAVIDGVQRLYALNLADRPAAEVLPLAAVTWVEVLWSWIPWNEALDAWRLPVAFRGLAASVERWPAPRQLRAHLPARRTVAPALAAPVRGPTPEQRAALDAVRADLLGIDRRRKAPAFSVTIAAEDKAATDAASAGTEL